MKKTDIAYMAGLVDGEAYIGIKRVKDYSSRHLNWYRYSIRIQIRMADEPAINFISKLVGGSYYKEKLSAVKGRPLYCYSATDKKAQTILEILLPYLRVKKRSAETALEFRALQSTSKNYRTKIMGYRNFPNKVGTVRIIPNLALSDEYMENAMYSI